MLDSFESLHRAGARVRRCSSGSSRCCSRSSTSPAWRACSRPWRYARSVFGIIDLVAVLPTWAALFFPGLHALIDVRLLRLLRLFRILKLAEYVEEYGALGRALVASRRKILVFLSFVLLVVVVMGTVMYVVEGPAHGFTNIPVSVYWAISTMTTVGFGDITPKTGLGRFIASMMMLVGWGTLAVPTGIVSAEFTALRMAARRSRRRAHLPRLRPRATRPSARFCQDCGAALPATLTPGPRGRARGSRASAILRSFRRKSLR